ncbi:MAG: ABC transporter permease subunit [Acidimicrobiia bacterium]
MNWDHVRAIAGADMRRLFKSKDYWIPLMMLATLFFVFMPLLALGVIGMLADTSMAQQLAGMVDSIPVDVSRSLPADDPGAQAAYLIAVYMLAPIAIIVPLTISVAVASNAIVGERERGTGEFLAHSPLTMKEIYFGKLLASLVPGYLITIVGFALYSLVVNLTVGPKIGGWFFPTSGWFLLIIFVIPPIIAIAIALVLRLSARMRSAAAAQQASSLVSLPIIIVSYALTVRVISAPGPSALLIGGIAWAIALLLAMRGAGKMKRERLLGVASET